jgi:hypothetical protein
MPAFGQILESERKKDFEQVITFYKSFEIDKKCFEKDYLELINKVHQLAAGIDVIASTIEGAPEFVIPYLFQIKSDAIQVLSLMVIGNERGVNLLERSLIESTYRYIYYYHHEIEHQNLEKDPGTYKTLKYLREYLKTHPFFAGTALIHKSLGELNGKYSELSVVIHAGIVNKNALIDNITSLHNPLSNVNKHSKNFDELGRNIMFLLLFFNSKELSMTADEHQIATLLLDIDQKKQLSKLI